MAKSLMYEEHIELLCKKGLKLALNSKHASVLYHVFSRLIAISILNN
jgi:hypothetical protein